MTREQAVIFIIFAAIFAIGILIYVVVDILVSLFRKDKDKKDDQNPVVVPVVAPIVAPVPDDEPEPVVVPVVLPPFVDHIVAEEADEMITDDVALAVAEREKGAGEGYRSYINLGVIDKNFNSGDTITLSVLKERKLINKKVQRLKVLADGELTKPITVKAESYSVQAIKMIELTGGTVIILEPDDDPNAKANVKGKKKNRK